jgi:hypothetical protein
MEQTSNQEGVSPGMTSLDARRMLEFYGHYNASLLAWLIVGGVSFLLAMYSAATGDWALFQSFSLALSVVVLIVMSLVIPLVLTIITTGDEHEDEGKNPRRRARAG